MLLWDKYLTKYIRMKYLFLLIITFSIECVYAQHSLEVNISGYESTQGKLQIALYGDKDDFLNFESSFRNITTTLSIDNTKVVFNNVPNGIYSIAIFHDLNDNGDLDTNWIGIPKEPIGVSGTGKSRFGPPKFKDCQFELNKDREIEIKLTEI
jgi:uncharacterized protein (DUF2141 family)